MQKSKKISDLKIGDKLWQHMGTGTPCEYHIEGLTRKKIQLSYRTIEVLDEDWDKDFVKDYHTTLLGARKSQYKSIIKSQKKIQEYLVKNLADLDETLELREKIFKEINAEATTIPWDEPDFDLPI